MKLTSGTIIYTDPLATHVELAAFLDKHNIKYVFDTSEILKQNILLLFSPCVVVTRDQAIELAQVGAIHLYDGNAWEPN